MVCLFKHNQSRTSFIITMQTSCIPLKHGMRTFSVFLVALLVMGVLPHHLQGQTADSPNIVFILVDDHRWDALSILNHPMVQTPNLDRLCQEGVRFENAFVTTSLCSPSRASFLTGQYARTHGVQNNLTPWNNTNRTFFEQLKAAGYDTAFIGKWHMPGKLPQLKGVDRFITFTVQGGQGRYFDCPLIIDGIETPSRKHYITEELTDYAIEFVEQQRNTPFCLYLSHKAVHHQFLPPPHIAGMYRNKAVPMPPEADNWISWNLDHLYCGLIGPLKWTYRKYMETLHATDLEIGRLLDRLDSLGMTDNTIIIYWGDNGFFFGEHRLMDKRWPYEESIRVLCIVRDPRHRQTAGKTAPQMVLNIDVAPTILAMAGLPPLPGMAGKSMLPFLANVSLPGREAWLYEYFQDFPYRIPNTQAVRTNRYKYVEYQGRRPDELFDLQKDPREQHNLMGTAQASQLLPSLRARLEELRQEVDR
jgi:arylsulfatase A-like enzyme